MIIDYEGVELLDEGTPCPTGGYWHHSVSVDGDLFRRGDVFYVLDRRGYPRQIVFENVNTGTGTFQTYSRSRFVPAEQPDYADPNIDVTKRGRGSPSVPIGATYIFRPRILRMDLSESQKQYGALISELEELAELHGDEFPQLLTYCERFADVWADGDVSDFEAIAPKVRRYIDKVQDTLTQRDD